MNPTPVALTLDPGMLRPLVIEVVREVVAELRDDVRKTGADDGRLAFSEPEAARLLGLLPHQLKDARLRGMIRFSRVTGRRVRYQRQDLLDYLLDNRVEAEARAA